MHLSIIIPHYKTPQLLKECILSIHRTIKIKTYEIIIVDIESDGSIYQTLPSENKSIRCILLKQNTGYAKAVNAGIKHARGKYFLILNPDIIVNEYAIDRLVNFMDMQSEDQRIGMIAPKLFDFDNNFQHSAFRFYTPLTILLRRTFLGKLKISQNHLDNFLLKDKDIQNIKDPQIVDWLMGSALFTSKSAVQDVGGMDERFFMYFEDVDWARRFWENGYKVIYMPNITMRHKHKKASRKWGVIGLLFNKMTRIHIRSAMLYFKKYKFKTKHYV